MNALQLACTSKSTSNYKNFDNIAIGAYEVLEFRIVVTKFGKKIRVKTVDFYCYLPDRFAEFLNEEKQIEEINRIPHIMLFKGKEYFRGKDNKQRSRVDLKFIPMNESQWM